MSEAVRSYRAVGATQQAGSSFVFRGGIRLTRYLLIVLLFWGVYFFWISRDTRRVEEFVQGDTTFRMVAQNLVENRSRLQQSTVWDALPQQWRSHPLPQLLQVPVGFPEWVQRNLVGQYVFISGRDAGEFTDAVYITKLSRVGSVLERMLRFSSGNEGDDAGGLKIRQLKEYDLYYAIRGRIALASPSRRALIHSLTLTDSELAAAEDWDESIWQLGDEDLRGTLLLGDDSGWGGYFSGMGFALRLEPDRGFVKLSLPCTESFYDAFGNGVRNTSARDLLAPMDGPIQLSANLNGTAARLWDTLGTLTGADENFSTLWEGRTPESKPESLESYLAQSLGDAGPGISITWHGFEMNTIVPSTLFSMSAEVRNDSIAEEIERLSGSDTDRGLDAVSARFDDEQEWIEAVGIGGPARTAVLMPSDDRRHVFVSSSKVLAESLWAGEARVNYMTEKANVYLRVSPGEVVEWYVEYGTVLAADGLLEGYGVEEFAEYAEDLRAKTAGIKLVEMTARYDNGVVEADIMLESKALEIDHVEAGN